LEEALQIQGRFSVIADVSQAYGQISNSCIREAINRMEHLSSVRDDQWDTEREKFDHWCRGAIEDIDSISRKTSENMDRHADDKMKRLQYRAIEAAEDARNH
jgi:hypothetical protein